MAEDDLIWRWWESVNVTIASGNTIEAPSDMATEVVLMNEEKTEAMLGRSLPVLESREGCFPKLDMISYTFQASGVFPEHSRKHQHEVFENNIRIMLNHAVFL
jgi:hypothetical protein